MISEGLGEIFLLLFFLFLGNNVMHYLYEYGYIKYYQLTGSTIIVFYRAHKV